MHHFRELLEGRMVYLIYLVDQSVYWIINELGVS